MNVRSAWKLLSRLQSVHLRLIVHCRKPGNNAGGHDSIARSSIRALCGAAALLLFEFPAY
jgi:hypothetical protein